MTDIEILESIEGLMSIEACRELYACASGVYRKRAIVEIGVYMARSTCWLGAGAQSGAGATVYGFDLWDTDTDRPRHRTRQASQDSATRIAAYNNVHRCGLSKAVLLEQRSSVEAAATWSGKPVGLLFIDGDHSARAVRADVMSWAPHLAKNATILLDDYTHGSGVRSAVDALIAEGVIVAPDLVAGRLARTHLIK
jgi:hypothetical protein